MRFDNPQKISTEHFTPKLNSIALKMAIEKTTKYAIFGSFSYAKPSKPV